MNDFLLKMRGRLTRWTCKLILCNLSGGFCCLMPGGMSGIPSITGIFTLSKCNSPSKATSPKVTFNTTMRQIYLFLFSFFALLITLVAPMVIGKGHPEKNEESPFPETNKTAAESHDEKQNLSLNRIMIIKENYSHEETNLPQTLRGKSSPDTNIKVPIKGSTAKTKHDTTSEDKDRDFDGCRKEDMIVHTAELGLPTKYIQPKTINAYQCKGKCSPKQWRKHSLHSLLKAYLEEKKGIIVDNNACCVPTKLRPVSLIYYDEKLGFVRHILDDAIVQECGCY